MRAAGTGKVGVEVLTLGGLFATMYTDISYANQVSTVAVTGIDFLKSNTPYISAADPSNDALFSLRYAGFLQANSQHRSHVAS